MRPTYRLEWEFDGVKAAASWSPEDGDPDFEPARRLKVRTYLSRSAAYRAAAIRLIFSKRDKLGTGRDGFKVTGCRACDLVAPNYEDGTAFCRYHGGDGFDELVERLARWLKHRDMVREAAEDYRQYQMDVVAESRR
jgi:hypothetical protein